MERISRPLGEAELQNIGRMFENDELKSISGQSCSSSKFFIELTYRDAAVVDWLDYFSAVRLPFPAEANAPTVRRCEPCHCCNFCAE